MNFSKQVEDIIADFRGLPRTATASSKQAPVPLDSVLELLKEKYKLEKPSAERSIVEHWHEIFGTSAGRCHPLSIKDERILVISVTNQTLRSELQFQETSRAEKNPFPAPLRNNCRTCHPRLIYISNMNHLEENNYLDLLRTILESGTYRDDRTGTGTYSVFGAQTRFSLDPNFPLLTTKKTSPALHHP